MAAAAGLARLPGGVPDDRTARTASTYGVGELIRDALDRGARRIVLAVGGSATTDGGAGMAAALGARFWTSSGPLRPEGGAGLLGRGTARPRRSGRPARGRLRRRGLRRRQPADRAVRRGRGVRPAEGRAAGRPSRCSTGRWATGRTSSPPPPGATCATCRERAPPAASGSARRRSWGPRCGPGIDTLLDLSGFARTVAGADLVIVGEGSLDEQSLRGKGPIGVAAAAARAGARVVAVAGRSTVAAEQVRAFGIDAVHALSELEPDAELSMRHAADLLETTAERIAAEWLRDLPERTP